MSTVLLHPVFPRCHAGGRLEVLAKEGRVGEIHHVADLLDTEVLVA